MSRPVGEGERRAADLVCELATKEHAYGSFATNARQIAERRVDDVKDRAGAAPQEIESGLLLEAYHPPPLKAEPLCQGLDVTHLALEGGFVGGEQTPGPHLPAHHPGGERAERRGVHPAAQGEEVPSLGIQVPLQLRHQQLPQPRGVLAKSSRCGTGNRVRPGIPVADRDYRAVRIDSGKAPTSQDGDALQERPAVGEDAMTGSPDRVDQGIEPGLIV